MLKIKTPILGINPKSYMYGDRLLEIAKYADKLAERFDITITFSAPYVDLANLVKETQHLIITAQGMDGITVGRGMGAVLPESLVNIGVKGVTINHAERPMTTSQLVRAVYRAKELGLNVSVCADSIEEARMIATLKPTFMVCEPTSLIGTGITSDKEYMIETKKAIKEVCSDIIVFQGAGTKDGKDVYNAIKNGAEGTGGSSGIFCSSNPKAVIRDMVEALIQAKNDFCL